MAMALTGEPLPAEKAAECGLIWKAVEDEALDAEVDALASKLASLPPLGLAATKQLVRSTWGRTLDEELDVQAGEMRRLGFTEDYREGVGPPGEAAGEVHRALAVLFHFQPGDGTAVNLVGAVGEAQRADLRVVAG